MSLRQSTEETASETEQARQRRPEEVTVLVVDDEVDIATYLSSVLEDIGMNIKVAHDGEKALAVMKQPPLPDLISLDLVMPRKSGIKFLAELRRNREWSRIPVIMVTAHAKDPEVRKSVDQVLAASTMVGPSLYLEKPVTPQRYLRKICEILGVAAPIPESPNGDSHQALRDEAKNLLNGADAATIEEVLGRLRRTGS